MGQLYSKLKVFHFKEKVDSLPATVKTILAPLHIRIKPTNACNHRCSYCAYRVDALQLGQDMLVRDLIPREKMMEILDDVIEMKVGAVTFSGGGEPFIYPYLLDAVRKLAGSGVKFASLTNGAYLKGEVAGIFAAKGMWVRVSMDGWDDASYSMYRGAPDGEYGRIMQNMKDFKDMGGACLLGVNLIVDHRNAAHVYASIRRLKDVRVNSVQVSRCIVSNDAVANNAYHQAFFDLVKDQLARARHDLAAEGFEIHDAYHQLDDKFEKDYTWCPYAQILPVIGADLNVYSCQDKAYNLKEGLVGTIRDKRFRDFWFSDKNKFFRINPSRVCGHHCVANDKNKIIHEYLDIDPDHLAFV